MNRVINENKLSEFEDEFDRLAYLMTDDNQHMRPLMNFIGGFIEFIGNKDEGSGKTRDSYDRELIMVSIEQMIDSCRRAIKDGEL